MDQNKLNSEAWPTAAIVISMLNKRSNKRFAVVGLIGMAIDLLMFRILVAKGSIPTCLKWPVFFRERSSISL